MHPAPGHSEGTLVNALLHHCELPAMRYSSGSTPKNALESPSVDDSEEIDEEALVGTVTTLSGPPPVIRPGIVHRLDKGTSGLLVVAKVPCCSEVVIFKLISNAYCTLRIFSML